MKNKKPTKRVAEKNSLPQDRAAELEQYLKSRMESFPHRKLMKDIRVEVSDDEKRLFVTIVPKEEAFSFDKLKISLETVSSEAKWKARKGAVYGSIKGIRPGVSPEISQKILAEANASLDAWREEHPFSDEMDALLMSQDLSGFFGPTSAGTLRFLAGDKKFESLRAVVSADTVKIEFKGFPYKAVYDIRTGETRFSLAKANALYKGLSRVVKEAGTQNAIRAYLEEKDIPATVQYAGKPGVFQISFHFDYGKETETVVIEKAYRRIVTAAYRKARERADQRERELEDRLRTCPYYGTFIGQAVLATIEENKNRLTKGQIVNVLRGTNLSEQYTFGEYAGKFKLMQKADIIDAIDSLEQYGMIRERCVRGQYQDYYPCFVTPEGKLFERLHADTVPKKNPVTEQEYHFVLKAVKEDIPRLSSKEKQKLLQVIVEKKGLFYTDPVLVLDCLELMGKPAADYLQPLYEKEKKRTDKKLLKYFLSAAAGKGKEISKNGVDAFRERIERERRRIEEEERKSRRLFELVLTEIPDNYVDLYPAARLMHRQFVLHIGPTNSGKTHDALEELMKADNGIYLGPLRLLAYEQYEKMNRAECPCSLVTGEEQFIIDGARHQSSTIEMLSLKTQYDVAVIDEAQMIADNARGGAWTTAIMGVCAKTVHVCAAPEAEQRIVEIIKDCGDDYRVIRHKRMTPLVYEKKTVSFPDDVKSGDALIVFSRRNVHAVAAQLRKKHIKCSIIYGALPYDVRHRQAELFAAKKTDVVVATDAIGMGMNLPVRRVVLMETGKFDGFEKRPLTYGEIAQIIGRAGRYGIYNVGYAATANGDERVKKAVNMHLRPIEKAVIDFPETLLTVDATILELIRKWEQVIPAEGWQKESVEQILRLAELTERLNAPKHLAYDFLTIPFEDENNELLNIWYDIFEKEVKGMEYSIFDQVEAIRLRSPSAADAIDALEQQHRVLDLYYALARKFQPLESTLDYILERKRDCSERIMKVLARQGFKEKKCKICGRMLPWNHPYGICEHCWYK